MLKKSAFAPIAQRMIKAENEFISSLIEQFEITTEEAEKVLRVFIKAKAVKLQAGMGRYNLTHGAYWESDVIQNALAMSE